MISGGFGGFGAAAAQTNQNGSFQFQFNPDNGGAFKNAGKSIFGNTKEPVINGAGDENAGQDCPKSYWFWSAVIN